ncbi:MAG: hypothetical protein O3C14_02595, partial [Proteobacteria bacterium]|nr:hypothetical protein [Pseudomonadota bacterium]
FRHSLRDRLRAVECPSDIIDQIGGWQTAGVSQSYGERQSNGYPDSWPNTGCTRTGLALSAICHSIWNKCHRSFWIKRHR